MYNRASGVETSIAELATVINRITGNGTPIHLGQRREWSNRRRTTLPATPNGHRFGRRCLRARAGALKLIEAMSRGIPAAYPS